MGEFLSKLRTEQLSEGTLTKKPTFKLVAPLIYNSNTIEDLIEVPTDFVTDFATVPRLPVVYMLLGNLGNSAAALHDFLYTYPHVPNTRYGTKPVTRKLADEILRGAIIDGMEKSTENEEVSAIRKYIRSIEYKTIGYLYYAGVRVGGASHWGQKPK